MSNKKRKMIKKQKATLRRMKKARQIDSNNLRTLIAQKQIWARNEKVKGLKQIEAYRIQVERLNGILLFIDDLLKPPIKEGEAG